MILRLPDLRSFSCVTIIPNLTALCHHYGRSRHTEESAYYNNKGQAILTQRLMLNDYLVPVMQTEATKPHKMKRILIKI